MVYSKEVENIGNQRTVRYITITNKYVELILGEKLN